MLLADLEKFAFNNRLENNNLYAQINLDRNEQKKKQSLLYEKRKTEIGNNPIDFKSSLQQDLKIVDSKHQQTMLVPKSDDKLTEFNLNPKQYH
jgi:hypothetical protein